MPAPRALLLYPVAALAAWLPVEAQDRPTLRARHTDAHVAVDGRLNESVWATADSIASLTQVEPAEGAAASAVTVVRVLATTDALIVGIRADDPDPRRITSFSRQRDADLEDEDHVRVVLDTYLDGRSGYVFGINPGGARLDALITAQGEDQDDNWDTVWEARSARTPTGWSAELRIPAKSLLFRTGLSEWGFNVERRIQRFQENDRWATPDRDVRLNMMSRAGLLIGVPQFFLGFGSSVRPSAKASAGIPAPGSDLRTTGDVSLDATQRLGANTLASVTLNTDFGETEVDARRTNLTRFPLFFPEKRTFFLEGSDIFAFGLGTGDDVRAFFSRRIGLLNGEEVPLDAGLKVNGRNAGTSYGALVVRTGALDTLPTRNTMGVVRLRQNVLRESSVGVIGTFGDPLARGSSWTAGADLTYQTTHLGGDQNFLAGAWGIAMDRDGLAGRRHAFGGKVDFPNDLWDAVLTYKWLGESFDPSLGFVPRPGVQIITTNVTYAPRPEGPVLGLPVRQLFYEVRTDVVTELAGRWASYRVSASPVNVRFESGDDVELHVAREGERLVAPFEIEDGIVLPPGTYEWVRGRVEASSASKRTLGLELGWSFGGFYTGRLDELDLEVSWKPSPLFIIGLEGERNIVRLAEGRFTQDVTSARVAVNLSPDLQVNSFLQYDNESASVGTNTRLRWSFSPVGELFVVYNHNVVESLVAARRSWGFESNQLLVKAQYAFRM